MVVAILKNEGLDYCRDAPFHPPEKYPEYPFEDVSPGNDTYAAVRQLLFTMGMDPEHYGTPSWNPLGTLIRPGDHVFLKPNLVGHNNPVGGIECLITQGSVIRPLLDYVYIALQGEGKITIGDSPQMETDFDAVVRATGIDWMARYYEEHAKLKVGIVDIRKVQGHVRKIGGVASRELIGDPMGYRVVDLKEDSEHQDIIGDCGKFRVADYHKNEVSKHHNSEKNEYCISGSILDADVIINIPKMKTHAKSGLTCALKNLIGINGYKDWLPHHRTGSAEEGGDEYIRKDFRKGLVVRLRDDMASTNNMLLILPMRAANIALILSKMVKPFNDPCIVGSWHGNDTLPRTIVDLNKILMYADRDGKMHDMPQRRMFILVDGIVAGEKEGPMTPAAHHCGVLFCGHNPVEVDAVCSEIMGFDYRKIPVFRYALFPRRYRLLSHRFEEMEICSERAQRFQDVYAAYNCHIVPPDGWKGHIEHELVSEGREMQVVAPLVACK